MGHLAARIQNELVHAAVPSGDRAAALNRGHALAGGGDLAGDLDRRIERGFDLDVDEGLQENVVAPVFMQQRRVRQARRQHVVHGGQLLQIDLDARSDILGLGSCSADAHRDQFADLAHLLAGERRLLGRLEPRKAGHGDDRLHADEVRGREGLAAMLVGNVNGAQVCMGERRANESDVFHAREANIAHKLAAPA